MTENNKEENLQELQSCVKFINFALNQESNDSSNLKAVEQLKTLRDKINNSEDTIPIGDIHGDPLLFLGWIITSGAALIDQDNPIIKHKTGERDSNGNEIEIDIFNIKPNPNYNGKLVFLGDYIDRGPSSESIFFSLTNFLKLQKEQRRTNVTALLGNHETNLFHSKSSKKNPNIARELKNNISLFKLCHIDGDNIYSHTNMFSDEVIYDAKATPSSPDNNIGIDEYILRRLQIYLADSRIKFIKQKNNSITAQIPDDEDLKVFKDILSFYQKKDHTKDEIESFTKNVNELLNIYNDENTNEEVKKIATVFMSSLSFARAVEKGQAAHLDNTEMVLYKGHDVKGASGTHVKNMDIGASAWMEDKGTTHFYIGKEKGDISLEREEVKQVVNCEEFSKKQKKELNNELIKILLEGCDNKLIQNFFKKTREAEFSVTEITELAIKNIGEKKDIYPFVREAIIEVLCTNFEEYKKQSHNKVSLSAIRDLGDVKKTKNGVFKEINKDKAKNWNGRELPKLNNLDKLKTFVEQEKQLIDKTISKGKEKEGEDRENFRGIVKDKKARLENNIALIGRLEKTHPELFDKSNGVGMGIG